MNTLPWFRMPLRRAPSHERRAHLQLEMLERREVMTATLWNIGNGVFDLSQTFLLHSNPTAKHVVYLDFDGHTTTNIYGSSWDNLTSPAWDLSGNGASFTDTEKQIIQKVWARVAEDFAPFNIDVTTQDPGLEALRKTTSDDRWGVRVVITPDDRPAPGSGGVAYIGSFNFNTDTPVYVFNKSEKSVAEAASHEVGHALGLNHDGTSTMGYYSGHGSGATSWGPIMGASYSPNVTQWSMGEYSGANNKEDDLAKITSQNGFTYRSDDYGSTQANAFELLSPGETQVSALYGIIEQNTDADWFSFYAGAGTVALKVDPVTLGPNLAIRADLYDANGNLLITVNPPTALNAVVNFTVPSAGEYFLKITGTGKGDPRTNGFSSYASLGNYRITGTVPSYQGGGGFTNTAPIANADTAATVAGTTIVVNVLANDSDANGDTLSITGVTNVQNGTAVVSGGTVIFTPNTGFTGAGSFTYSISDGKGGTASATATVMVNAASTAKSFTNNTDVAISARKTSTVYSNIKVSGQSGTIQDVEVKLNIRHTWIDDLQITLIAPNGTRIVLFNRHGGNGDNLLNTVFDDSADTSIADGAAPFTGVFRPWQALSGLNGLSPNGTWRLEVRDNYAKDGGKIDNWTLTLTTSAATTARTAASASDKAFADLGSASWLKKLNNFAASYDVQSHFGHHGVPPLPRNVTAEAVIQWASALGTPAGDKIASLFEEWYGAEVEDDLPFGG